MRARCLVGPASAGKGPDWARPNALGERSQSVGAGLLANAKGLLGRCRLTHCFRQQAGCCMFCVDYAHAPRVHASVDACDDLVGPASAGKGPDWARPNALGERSQSVGAGLLANAKGLLGRCCLTHCFRQQAAPACSASIIPTLRVGNACFDAPRRFCWTGTPCGYFNRAMLMASTSAPSRMA
jgi:hypothetical protein